jgi:periplasmic protein TonB
MSNVSIYEKNWTELVFEDKNKAYGAYQLRQENPRTTLLAFFVGTTFILVLIGSWLLLSSFGTKPEDGIADIIPNESITPVDLSDSPRREEPIKPLEQTQAQSQTTAEPTNLSNMVVAATPLAVDNVPTNDNLPAPSANNGPTGTAIDVPGNDGPANTTLAPAVDNTPRGIGELDRLPEFPGTIKKFYEYVGNNIERSEFESSVSVIMGFVIEKDGSMTDIKVLRGNDKALEKEAIRVLKSLKVKWSPGYKDGQKVRTQYTLPIKVTI